MEVGVNVAGDSPTGNLSITVFRHQNDTDLQMPRYVWETLATIEVTPQEISQAFEVVRVPVKVAVKAGDKLGIALVSDSATSMCVLVTGGPINGQSGVAGIDTRSHVATAADSALFAIGVNQVSYRGPDGKTSPVVVLPGEIKWYSVVV